MQQNSSDTFQRYAARREPWVSYTALHRERISEAWLHVFQGLLREDDLQHFDDDFRKHFQPRRADISSDEDDD